MTLKRSSKKKCGRMKEQPRFQSGVVLDYTAISNGCLEEDEKKKPELFFPLNFFCPQWHNK